MVLKSSPSNIMIKRWTKQRELLKKGAYQKAVDQGAEGSIKVELAVFEDYYDLAGGEGTRLFLETKVIGKAAAE